MKTLDGKKVTLESLRGSPVVLNFWATWCGPCYLELPVLKEARETFAKEGVAFLGIVYQDEKENVERFVSEYDEPFVILFDPEGKTAIDFGVGGVPETFFIDKEGVVQHKHTGVLDAKTLKENIDKLHLGIDQKVKDISEELRCPVCRGVPIAESPSTLAQDMMQVIRQRLEEGKSKEEILSYFEDRYGEWILLKPKPEGMNLIVWVLPILLFVGGGIFLVFKISRWSREKI